MESTLLKLAEERDREKYLSEITAIHSREKIQLCQEVILDSFGAVAARVASVLLQRGRLNLREISRFLVMPPGHASTGMMQDQEAERDNDGGLDDSNGGPSNAASVSSSPLRSQRLIQRALLTLIQHNICWHVNLLPNGTITPQDMRATSGVEYFQINVDEVLPRVRFGVYLAIAETEFDALTVEVVHEILQNGKMRALDVITKLNPEDDDQKAQRIREILRDLLYAAYLKPTLAMMHTSARDRKLSYIQETENIDKKILAPKARGRIEVDAAKRVEMDEKCVWREDMPSGRRRGLIPATKRRAVNGKGHSKRGKITKKSKGANGRSHVATLAVDSDSEIDEAGSDPREAYQIDPAIFLRVNFDRFDIHIRDDIIFSAVEQRYNRTTAEVAKALMKMNIKESEEVPSVKDEQSAILRLNGVRRFLPENLSLRRTFERDALKQELGSEPSQSALVEEIVAILLGAGDISRVGMQKRLVSPFSAGLQSHSQGMNGNRAPTQMYFEYGNASRTLREQLLRNVVEVQFGTAGTRIMSLLRDMGKLEEKHISKLTLMPMGETRDVCARLFASSLIALQEVPKSSERIATRTIFFWYVDEKKCTSWLCDHLYKTLSRLVQRRRFELQREADLLIKSQRTDVVKDQSLMNHIEQRRLQRVRETINVITLGELRTWKDLFIVLNLPA